MEYCGSGASDTKWDEGFNIGMVAKGKVKDVEDVGLAISFEKHNDVFGFIANYQCNFSPSHMVFSY